MVSDYNSNSNNYIKFNIMIVSAIVAMDLNRLIGMEKNMPWHLPKDFKYFKETTINHPIIIGRVSFESKPINSNALPDRTNIVVSKNYVLAYDGIVTVTSIEDAISVAKSEETDECFIIGGGKIYKKALESNLVNRLYVTTIHTEIKTKGKDNLVYFPEINYDEWDMTNIKAEDADDNNKYNMTFLVFERN